jgi:hypothetical protein
MELEVLLAKYFPGCQTEEVVIRLKRYELYGLWSVSVIEFYKTPPGDGTSKACFCRHMESCLLPLLNHSEIISAENTFGTDYHSLAMAASWLILHAMKHAGITASGFIKLFLQTIIYPYYPQHESLMLGELIKCLIAIRDAEQNDVKTSNPPQIIPVSAFSMNWTLRTEDKGDQLPLFADDAGKLFPGLKTPKCLVALLHGNAENIMLTVPHFCLCDFLTLVDLMYRCGRISCTTTKGIMLFMSHHIKAPDNEIKYNPGLFRLKKSRAMANPAHKENIKMKIREIFFKYCTREADRILFEKYFL